ncbi:MAG: hypothetical protein IH598_05735 [Bacteroidales bacterium]|nr:hypothetical protein [Bacteroidales bacterium]
MIFLKYAQSELVSTRKARIIDFMNLFEEDEAEVIKKAFWYPLDKIELEL